MAKKSSKAPSAKTDSSVLKTLVIAEKPSVAADLAKVLKVPKSGDVFENNEWIISSAVGHLVKLKDPEDLDPIYKRWTLKDLPMLPKKYDGTIDGSILKVIINSNIIIEYNFNKINIKHKKLKNITIYDMAKYNKLKIN
jgi:DNA topoisomerase IA